MNNSNSQKDFLSKQNTNAIKGLLSIFIVIHHLYGWTNILRYPMVSVILIGYLGSWSVSLFFFFSGYGLWNSVLSKKTRGVHKIVSSKTITSVFLRKFFFDIAIHCLQYFLDGL